MSKVFFVERTRREIHPKALTFPFDNLFVDRKLVAFIKLRLSPPGHQKKQGFLRNLICTCHQLSEDLGLKQIPTALGEGDPMGFFSKKSFGGSSERELEEFYVDMYVSAKGFSRSDARKAIREFIQQAKEEAQREGTADLPQNFGDELLAIESTDEKVKAMFSKSRKEGVTDEDIRWWWNMPDLERRLMLKDDENSRIALLKKFHPMYGNPNDTSKSSGDDRPLPFELEDRINRYIEMRREQGGDFFKADLEATSSFNALVRREIRNGNL